MAKYRPNISRLYPQRQVPRPNIYDLTNQQRRRGPSKDGDLVNLLAKGTSLGYSLPTATTEASLETYIKGLKDAGIWTKLDVLYVFATDGDSDFATLNLKDPDNHQCTKVNSPTFTSLEGFAGNGTSSYLSTNWIPSTDGVNYLQTNASYGFYVRTNMDNSGVVRMGALTNTTFAAYEFSEDSFTVNGLTGTITATADTSLGLRHFNRTSNTSMNRYINGSVTNTNDSNSAGRPTVDFYVLARNFNGSPNAYSISQISIAFMGADLTTEAGDLFTLTEAYMDALGKGVVA